MSPIRIIVSFRTVLVTRLSQLARICEYRLRNTTVPSDAKYWTRNGFRLQVESEFEWIETLAVYRNDVKLPDGILCGETPLLQMDQMERSA